MTFDPNGSYLHQRLNKNQPKKVEPVVSVSRCEIDQFMM